jgi:hypothetical protein
MHDSLKERRWRVDFGSCGLPNSQTGPNFPRCFISEAVEGTRELIEQIAPVFSADRDSDQRVGYPGG